MNNLIEMFSALSAGKKMSLFLLFAASVSALVVLFMWANRPDYQVLFSNLGEEDAAQIIEELQNDKVQYKISSGGTISVPREHVYEMRLRLAGAGLTSGGGVGFEIFDRKGFGITEFVQKVNYTRALQGELARTVSGLAEVETARIHIVAPEKRLFAEDGEGARASVVLKLKGGIKLKPGQVQGIVNLVAGSVSGLKAESVTVIDSNGNLLTKVQGDDSTLNMTSNQLEYQRQIEKGFEDRIHDMLAPVVGIGKVIARVSAEIDFKQVQKTE
ncbi:MAG: flagellar basal-body MS-ring/collar protein FliF [Thermodesulfobacteriota bacterium]